LPKKAWQREVLRRDNSGLRAWVAALQNGHIGIHCKNQAMTRYNSVAKHEMT
jgi:hypothetical protein